MFKPLNRHSRTDQIVEEIKAAVLSGRIKTGDKLPPERELATIFGVSRTSVRESVKILNTYGLIKSVQGDGIYVTDQFSENVLDFLGHGSCLTAENYTLLYQARLVMETGSLMAALDTIEESDIQKLEAIIRELVVETDIEKLGVLDANFHITLIEVSRNPILSSLYRILYKVLTNGAKAGVSLYPGAKKMVVTGHTRIVAAIKAKSKTRCYHAIVDHLDASMKLFEEYFERMS